MSNGSSSTNRTRISSSCMIDENPFNAVKYTEVNSKEICTGQKIVKPILSMDLLTTKKVDNINIESTIKKMDGIYNEIHIFSKNPLNISELKYYVFPMDLDIKNDDSDSFLKNHQAYLKALKSAFNNFRKFGHKFIVQIEGGLILFLNKLKCTLNLKSVLEASDINYSVNSAMLLIEDSPNLVVDLLINYDIRKGATIPFILGYYEFNYSFVRPITVRNGPIVENGNSREYMYSICGPVYSGDLEFPEHIRLQYKK